MTEKEFIEQYVANNCDMIEQRVAEHRLTREAATQRLMEAAHIAWMTIQQAFPANPTDKGNCDTDRLSLTDLRPGNIYTAYLPEENWSDDADEARKIIFTPVRTPMDQEEVIYAIFVLYKARSGSFVLDVCDSTAKCHCSRTSDLCVCRRHHTVGIDVNRIFDYNLRIAGKEEVTGVFDMLASAKYLFVYESDTSYARMTDVLSGKTIAETNKCKL